MPDTSWKDKAQCNGKNSNVFFPVVFTGTSKEQRAKVEQAAKAICADCPVDNECLEFAIESHEEAGIWGGLNEVERRSLVRVRKQTARRLSYDEQHECH